MKEGYLWTDSPHGTSTLSNKRLEHIEGSVLAKPSDPFMEHLLAIPDVGENADFDRDPSGLRHVDV